MKPDNERAELEAARDAAERQSVAAEEIWYEAGVARRLAAKKYNEAALAVYNYDAAQGE